MAKCIKCGSSTLMTCKTGGGVLLNICKGCYEESWEKRTDIEGNEIPPSHPLYVSCIYKEKVDEESIIF